MTSMSPMWRMTWFSSSTPLPPSMSRASAITSRAVRVLWNLARPAIVSESRPSSSRRASCMQYSCMPVTAASIRTSRSWTIWKPGSGCRRGPGIAAERAEEFRARGVEHHHVALLVEGGAVGLEAAVELRELRIAAERLAVDACRLGIALALDLLRVAVGVGDGDLALAVGVGADLLAVGGAGGAKFVGDAL